ncbi:MAG: outer membrane beta-barrel protein [Gemmatimonadota bacterium]
MSAGVAGSAGKRLANGPWIRLLRVAVPVLGLAVIGLSDPGRLPGQAPSGDPAAEPQGPPMAGTPRQFRIAATAGALLWGDEAGRPSADDGALVGLEIERRVGRFLGFRVGGAYGRTTLTGDTAAVRTNQYVVEIAVAPRLALGALRRAGVVPFAAVGIGALVHDPEADDLVTKSQSAVGFGGGLDLDLTARFGGRAEWRHYIVDSEDIFDPTDRGGRARGAERLLASLYLKF